MQQDPAYGLTGLRLQPNRIVSLGLRLHLQIVIDF